MRHAAKLNLSAIDRLQNLVRENPTMAFLQNIVKPLCEIVPQDPINALVDLIHVPKKPFPADTKYNVTDVTHEKAILIKVLQNGKFVHKCPICKLVKVSWGAINSHIKYDHFNQMYICLNCLKQCKSMDGMCRHVINCKKSNKST